MPDPGQTRQEALGSPTRRSVLELSLGLCSCAVCLTASLDGGGGFARADARTDVQGRGYDLHFVGAQRETIMNGKLAAAVDLRALAQTAHLYGLGPLEQLRGEVTI